MLNRQSSYQDVVLDLAQRDGSARAARLAADVMLRWKGLAGEEEAFLARLVNRAPTSEIAEAGARVLELRGAYSVAYHQDRAEDAARFLDLLEEAEADLASLSDAFRAERAGLAAGSQDVRAVLQAGEVLLEFRQYQPFDYESGTFEPPRLAAVLMSADAAPVFQDLGPFVKWRGYVTPEGGLKLEQFERLPSLIADLTGKDPQAADVAAAGPSAMLLAPFAGQIAAAERIYVAPDGVLNLVPFERLPFGDAKYWLLSHDVRTVQSGRVLLRDRLQGQSGALVAFGGVDYDDSGELVLAALDAATPPECRHCLGYPRSVRMRKCAVARSAYVGGKTDLGAVIGEGRGCAMRRLHDFAYIVSLSCAKQAS